MKITFWADYVCPYSYIGVAELIRALERRGLACELDMRSYLLDPDAPAEHPPLISENFIREDGQAGADQHMAAIGELAQKGGVPISLAGAPFARSMDAHRLTKWAAGQLSGEDLQRLILTLFRTCFVENRNIAESEVLLDAATACGLDRAAAAALLETEEGTQAALDDTAAGDRVLEVIPYFTAGGHVLTGEVTPEQVDTFLDSLADS